MKRSGKQARERVEEPAALKSDPLEDRTCCDVYRDLTNLTSQVQMMSDSLAACKQMSKYRPLRKTYGVKGSSPGVSAPEAPVQILLSPEQTSLDGQPDEEGPNVIVSYMMRETQRLRKSRSDSDNGSDRCQNGSSTRRCGSWTSALEEPGELPKESSRVQIYRPEEVDVARMIDVIQRDLKTLMDMAPPVSLLVTALSDTIFHYKGCDRCSEKISASLPWILNRIQKLVKYVTTKRQGSYRWPNDYSYLRLRDEEPTGVGSRLPPRGPRRFVGKLEKVDAISVTEDIPGVQLLLEVKPKKTKKRFFERVENRSLAGWEPSPKFSVVELREPESVPVVQVLVPSDRCGILVDEKREAVAVKEIGYRLRLVFAFRVGFLASLLILTPWGRSTKAHKAELAFQVERSPDTSGESVESKRNLIQEREECKGGERGGERGGEKSESLPTRSNEKKSFSPRKFLARVPEIVREFLQEAEKEKMYDQKMQNLETGMEGLKALMTEVHKNQIALSKILLDKGIYSQPIIKLTDPNLLEKENEMVRKAAETQAPGWKRSSLDVLQAELDSLKHKCGLKNRMIMIILKGLRSNIPKEWWEDMVEYVFDESKPIEEFDPEKVSEFVEQASSRPGNGEKASKLQARPLRSEEQPSEEEPKMKPKGIVGADVEENLGNRSDRDGATAKTKDSKASLADFEGFPKTLLAFPASGSPGDVDTTVRKLENQISLLNTENDRLWQEVHDLRNLLKTSVNDFHERRISRQESEQQASNLEPSGKPSGKTINLTIQIVDRDLRRLKDGEFSGGMKLSDVSVTEDLRRRTKSLEDECAGPQVLAEAEEKMQEPSLSLVSRKAKYSFRSKSQRRRSENDLNCLEDTSTVAEYRQESDKLRSVLRERAFGSRVMVATPHPSGHDLFQKPKPVSWVASKYAIPEVRDGRRSCPSRKPVAVGHLLQKPSLMELAESQSPGMFAGMANERELQTIPENDSAPPSSPSKGMSQAIQQLRTRVRSIHKDVAVLKSKNDRMDKLLDRLMEDAIENGESFEEMGQDLNRLKDQLG